MSLLTKSAQLYRVSLTALIHVSLACCTSEELPGASSPLAFEGQAPALCIDLDGDGYGRNCASGEDCNDRDVTLAEECAPRAEPSCTPGEEQACFEIEWVEESSIDCKSGYRTCTQVGTWGECKRASYYSVSSEALLGAAITGPVPCNVCDPACELCRDYPTNTNLSADNSQDVTYDPSVGGIRLRVEGLGLTEADGDGVPVNPTNPMEWDPDDGDPTVDGYTEHGELFFMLPFGAEDATELTFPVNLTYADIYILMDTTGSMGGEIGNLRNALTDHQYLTQDERDNNCPDLSENATHGIVGATRCYIPDASFGVGYFDDYPTYPYGSSSCDHASTETKHDVPYFPLLQSSPAVEAADLEKVKDAANKLVARCGTDHPESHLPALYALATGAGLPDTQAARSKPTAVPVLPPLAEDQVTAFPIGDLTASWSRFTGSTSSMNNDYSNTECWGGAESDAGDAVFQFSVSEASNIVVSSDNSFNSTLQLRDADFNPIYCQNGFSERASLFPHLDPGSYYLVLQGAGSSNGSFDLEIGQWPGNWVTEPGPNCENGGFGYPCFRPGTIPIVIMFTDAFMHNGKAADNRYTFDAPAYYDSVRALNRQGVKVISINSGSPKEQECSSACVRTRTERQCETREECTEWERSCRWRTYCGWGLCFPIYSCDDYICTGYEETEDCRDEVVCEEYGTPVCADKRGTTHHDLAQLARDTDTVDGHGNPLVYDIESDGTRLDQSVIEGIRALTNYHRINVTMEAVDNQATPHVDESQFLTQAVANHTSEAMSRCISVHQTWFERCLPGTQTEFNAVFRNDMIVPTSDFQVFRFDIIIRGDGMYVLRQFPVTIVVPPTVSQPVESGAYWRDYETDCEGDLRPDWGIFKWTADTPADSSIEFQASFSDNDDYKSLVPALTWQVPPNNGILDIGAMLDAQGKPNHKRNLRLRAVLHSSTDRTQSPTLQGFELTYHCVNVQ